MKHATTILLTLLSVVLFACFDYGNSRIEKAVKLINKDSQKAEQQFIQLAKKGNPDAQAWVGFMILFGRTEINKIIDQKYDIELAKPWLEKSIEGKSALGYFYLGVIDKQHYDYTQSNPYLEKSAAKLFTAALLEVSIEQLLRIPMRYPFNLQVTQPKTRDCSQKIGIDATHCQYMKKYPLPKTNKKERREAFKKSIEATRRQVEQRFYHDVQKISERLKQGIVPYSEEKILFNRAYMYDRHAPNNTLLKELITTPKAKLLMGEIFANMQHEWLGKGSVGVKGLAAERFLEVLQVTRNTEHIQLYNQAHSALKRLVDNGYEKAKYILKTY